MPAFHRVLIANRSEIALRILRTVHAMGLESVAVYSDADAQALHTQAADTAVRIGAAPPADSYLNIPALIAAARQTGADAVHPGYGFLSENAAFARAVLQAGLVWIGPSPQVMQTMGNKAAAKQTMHRLGVPTLAGYTGSDQSDAAMRRAAHDIGYPLMVKAAAGGGGRGMRLVRHSEELLPALAMARTESLAAFGSDELILEQALLHARHIEIQLLGDERGNCIHLGERDCSVQRRHQKLIEESPSPALCPALRARMGELSVQAAKALGYSGVGTMEFLLDANSDAFFFMEMNTRLQVEHAVTEALMQVDLVEWQLRVAAGEALAPHLCNRTARGHAIEVRLTAEDVGSAADVGGFLPQTGNIALWSPAACDVHAGTRIEHALQERDVVSPHYDSMLAKFIAHGSTRAEALRKLQRLLAQSTLLGVTTNQAFLGACLQDPVFAQGEDITTDFIARRLPHLLAGQSPPSATTVQLAAGIVAHHTASPVVHLSWIHHGSQEHRWRLCVDAHTLRNVRCTPSVLRAEVDGILHTCRYALVGERLELHHSAEVWCFDLTPPRAGQEQGEANGVVLAPMTGRITQLAVQEGEVIERAQLLAKIEAMKMEHSINAPVAGKIKTLHARAGSQLTKGALLCEIAP